MQFSHRISFSADAGHVKKFSDAGIQLDLGFTTLIIKESDEKWPTVQPLLKDIGGVDFLTTEFTRSELDDAKYFAMSCSRHQGYPQPENDLGYVDLVYDTSSCCKACSGGKRPQKQSFRFIREPKWGSFEILQLNWVFDEFFVTSELYDEVFQPFGIDRRDVIHHKSNAALSSVFQLVIPEVDVLLDMPEDSVIETCNTCGGIKYQAWERGYIPPLSNVEKLDLDIFKPNTPFGSGCESRKLVIVSARLRSILKSKGVKSLLFHPLTPNE